MKQVTLLFLSVLTLSIAGAGQAYESTIQYDKKKQPAIAIDYSYPPEAVENAIISRMEKIGYKAKEEKGFLNKDKGFLVFKNAYITEISKDKMDYIINVERKSRKESDESEFYMIMMKGDENAMVKMEAYSLGKAKSFLNNLIPDIEAAHLEIRIRDQEETLAKAEKKLKNLQEDRIVLDKKIEDNLKTQDETLKEIEANKLSLETLRGKRNKN
jgi:hypothetical protein